MSFVTNPVQQMTLNDSTYHLTVRERKALEKSWANLFSDELFPMIDEEPFRVLYCEDNGSPNTPVNIIVGACIIKELLDLSDDEIVEGLMLDIRLQYALHTTSFVEQPLSDKSLSRFRKRCYNYYGKTGVDLIHNCIVSLAGEIAKVMKITGRTRRMDSMMIDANIKKLSRLELIYTCNTHISESVRHSRTRTGRRSPCQTFPFQKIISSPTSRAGRTLTDHNIRPCFPALPTEMS